MALIKRFKNTKTDLINAFGIDYSSGKISISAEKLKEAVTEYIRLAPYDL